MDTNTPNCTLGPAREEMLAMLRQRHELLEQNIGKLLIDHAQCVESVVHGTSDTSGPSSQPIAIVRDKLPSAETDCSLPDRSGELPNLSQKARAGIDPTSRQTMERKVVRDGVELKIPKTSAEVDSANGQNTERKPIGFEIGLDSQESRSGNPENARESTQNGVDHSEMAFKPSVCELSEKTSTTSIGNFEKPIELSANGIERSDMPVLAGQNAKIGIDQSERPFLSRQASRATGLARSGTLSMFSSTGRNSLSGEIRETIRADSMLKSQLSFAAKQDHDSLQRGGPKPVHKCFLSIFKSSIFETASILAVLCNAVVIGVQTDWTMRNFGEELPGAFDVFEVTFTAFFASELLIRILASGIWFISCENDEISWNMFDSFLVASSLLEMPMLIIGANVNLTAARILRLMRLVRMLRMVRLFRFFKMLRLVVHAVAGSLKPLFWALLLLFVVVFITSVMILQLLEAELETRNDEVALYWGTLITAQYTLFSCITNGLSWQMAADPLISVSPMFAVIFIMFVSFSFFCVVNIVTSIFVENAKNMAQKDEEMVLLEETSHREQWVNEVTELFELADEDKSGDLTADELEERMSDIRVQVLLQNLGIDVLSLNPRCLFNAMDFDRSGSITIKEFADGVMRFHGNARSLDLAEVRHFVLALSNDVTECTELVKSLVADKADHKKGLDERPRSPSPPDFMQPPPPPPPSTLPHQLELPTES